MAEPKEAPSKAAQYLSFFGGIAWIGLFQLLFTMVVLTFPFFIYKMGSFEREFAARSVETTGVIVKLHKKTMRDSVGVRIDHEVRFTTRDGAKVTFIDHTTASVPAQLGQRVPIRYVPEDPKWAMITIDGLQETNRTMQYTFFFLFWLISLPLAYLTNRAQWRHIRGYPGKGMQTQDTEPVS